MKNLFNDTFSKIIVHNILLFQSSKAECGHISAVLYNNGLDSGGWKVRLSFA